MFGWNIVESWRVLDCVVMDIMSYEFLEKLVFLIKICSIRKDIIYDRDNPEFDVVFSDILL